MYIASVKNINNTFMGTEESTPANPPAKIEQKTSFLDKFETGIRNSADLNDTIQVPRTIFKGYLAFMVGTAMQALALIAKNKFPKTSIFLNIAAILTATWGTFSFVRPYILKGKKEN